MRISDWSSDVCSSDLLVPRAEGVQVLLTRRTDGPRHHGGQVAFPGGRVEPGDADACAAAIREANEEIGIVSAELQPMGWLDPLATVSGFTVLPLVAAVAVDFRPHPDPDEVAEVFEVPLDFLMHAPNLISTELDWPGRRRSVLEFADRGMPTQRSSIGRASRRESGWHKVESSGGAQSIKKKK